jgi:predicted nucleic acid-binding protein
MADQVYLANPGRRKPPSASSKLRWTASKASVVELVYALYAGAVYNNRLAEIKEIAETFEQLFQVDHCNYYHVFNEIRLRKKNRTSLLDLLIVRFYLRALSFITMHSGIIIICRH